MSATHGLSSRIGAWSARNRAKAIAGWFLIVAVSSVLGGMVGSQSATATDLATGEAGQGLQVLRAAGLEKPAGEYVLLQSANLMSTDAAFRAAVAGVVTAVTAAPDTTDVTDPYAAGAISADKHSVVVSFEITGAAVSARDRVQPVLDAVSQLSYPDITVAEVGDASGAKYLNDTFNSDFATAEWTAVPVALGILLIAFASLVAAVLPVVLAMTAYVAAAGLAALASHLLPTTEDAGSVMLLVGLAVGVDYCLFYLRRVRDERAAGRSSIDAIDIAAATSGRTVLISGVTVVAAMAGMFLTGITDFNAIALSTIIVVLIAAVGSLTVLPALLSLLGDRVNAGRLPLRRRRRPATADNQVRTGVVGSLLEKVVVHPVRYVVGAVVVLLALAAPALTMNTAQLSIAQELAPGTQIVQTANRIVDAFPGTAAPAQVIVTAPDVTAAAVTDATAQFLAAAEASGLLFNEVATVHADKNIITIDLGLAGAGTDDASKAALAQLRDTLIPSTYGAVSGTEVYVTGVTAESVDFTGKLDNRIPLVFAFVLALAFLLMLSSFRSLVVAVATVVLNLLSVGAAYGILTLVFQHNVGGALVGAHPVGAINAWVPTFLFVVLFGLSMDYHVFVVAGVKEFRDQGLSTRSAVVRGVSTSSGVITSAALIMVGVFAIFATLSVESMKQIAVGLAVAILVDATLIRVVLLPAILAAFGERSWYLPKWLAWVPALESEATPSVVAPVGRLAAAAAPQLVAAGATQDTGTDADSTNGTILEASGAHSG